ncbi:MAG: hypothetical protein IJM24_01935 [Clostridia bacterium]|nr:hypothetical protein [Clostridia bacterium]
MFKKRVAIMLVVCLLVSLVTVTGVMKSKATDATVTIDFSKQGFTNAQTVETVEDDGGLISISFSKGENENNPPKYYNTGSAVRVYGGNTFTVETTDGSNITKIQPVYSNTETVNYTVDSGSFKDGEWTGEADSVTFTNPNTSGHVRLQKLIVTLGNGGVTPTPVPSPTTPEEIWDQISNGDILSHECTLTGVVTSFDTGYTNVASGFVSVFMIVNNLTDKPFECFKMVNGADIAAGEGIEVLKVGDTITVSGTVVKYNSTVEFAQGCTLDALVPGEEPEVPVYETPEEIWDAASELANNAILPGGPYELTGVVTNVDGNGYNSQHNDITVDIVVGDLTNKPFRCYQMVNGANIATGEGVEVLKVGDTITVKGEITKYNSYVEFAKGCTLEGLVPAELPTYENAGEIWDAANELANNGTLPGGPYTLTGVVTEIPYKYNSTNKNITVNFVVEGYEDKPFQCFKLVNGDDIVAGKGIELLAVGDTITVTGEIKKYVKNNVVTIEFDNGCKLIEIEHTPQITSASLTLSESIAINFKVNENEFDATQYTPMLKVTFAGVETALQAEKVGTNYVFTFGKLTPAQMTEIASAKLYLAAVSGGEATFVECGSKDYSIAQYCYNQLRNTNNAGETEFLKLLVDLLVYGDKAMAYTGSTGTLATYDLTDAERALGTKGDPDLTGYADKRIVDAIGGEQFPVEWKGAGLNLTDSIMIRVKFKASFNDDAGYVIVVTDPNTEEKYEIYQDEFLPVDGAADTYYAFFPLPSPCELFTEYNFRLEYSFEGLNGDYELIYSGAAYAKSMLGKNGDPGLNALINAMVNYCQSAVEYVG